MSLGISILNLLLNPFCLLLFLFANFGIKNQFFTKTGTNVYRLNGSPYLIYCIIYIAVLFLGAAIVDWATPLDIDLLTVFLPNSYFFSIPVWCVTALTLIVYFNGMEGNIMGFIFFPLLMISCAALVVSNLSLLFQALNLGGWFWVWLMMALVWLNYCIKIERKGIAVFFTLCFATLSIVVLKTNPIAQLEGFIFQIPLLVKDAKIAFLLHAFAPLYLLLLFQEKEGENAEDRGLLVVFLASLILQILFFGVNWVVFQLFGDNALTFDLFFGGAQPLWYYSPMVIGFLYWIIMGIDQSIKKQPPALIQFFLALVGCAVVLECYFYIELVVAYF
ncbi:MAG: hypothetical protein AB8E82_02485 [Aureispira sp.]